MMFKSESFGRNVRRRRKVRKKRARELARKRNEICKKTITGRRVQKYKALYRSMIDKCYSRNEEPEIFYRGGGK